MSPRTHLPPTERQRAALGLLIRADPRYEGEGVVYGGKSCLINGQAWINYRTAEGLADRDLAVIEGCGDETVIRASTGRRT